MNGRFVLIIRTWSGEGGKTFSSIRFKSLFAAEEARDWAQKVDTDARAMIFDDKETLLS